MPQSTIASDAILSDVVATLHKPKEYVRRVLGNMFEFKKTHGAAVLRLGTTGRGIVPNYRVQKDHDSLSPLVALIENDKSVFYSAFHGRTHKQLEWGASE